MTRSMRQTAITAELEETYGVGATSWSAASIILCSQPAHRVLRGTTPRQIWYPHMGASEELVASRVAEIKFTVELAGSGTAGTAPPWGKLLRACGYAETITAATRVEYSPVSTGFESLTIRYFRAGMRYVSRGARGSVQFKLPAFGIPQAEFTFLGFDTQAWDGAALGSYDLTAWKRPDVLTDEFAGDIRFGCTFATGAVTGGTIMASRGLEINGGQKVEHMELLGGERISITDRETTGQTSVAVSAADEVAWRTDINANSLTTLGFNWGAVAGNRGTIWCPAVQRVEPQQEDYKGDLLIQTQLRMLPKLGNDDMILVVR